MELRASESVSAHDISGEPPRILVIDDDPIVLHAVVAMLAASGFEAESASCANEALRYLQDDPGCSLVLCDVMLSGHDGLSVLDAIGAEYPGIPVVMLSGLDDIHVATNAFRRGAVDYLLKPFDRAKLLGVVERALEHGRLRRPWHQRICCVGVHC